MKNTLIVILTLAVILVGYYAATTLRLPMEGLEGKTEKVIRSDLTIPINATGEVRPALRVEVKSEASGEVIEIAKRAGDRVRARDLLIRLQPDDEQRSVDRSTQELQIAEARLNTAKINLELARGSDLLNAKAQVNQLEPLVTLAKFRKEKLERLPDDQKNDEEVIQRDTDYLRQVAQLDAAKAGLERAKLAIPRSEYELKQAEASHETAKANLGDAQKRLTKTTILAPIDGVVADVKIQIGEVIQGGKTTLTGGTVLAVLLDVDKTLVRAEVDESDIGRVLAIAPPWAQPGHDNSVRMPADPAEAAKTMQFLPRITVESFRDEEFQGLIERIYPESKTMSGVVTYLVDVVVTSENRTRLLSGMRAEVRFTSEHVENVLLCPNEAIREGSNGRLGVYIPKAGAPPAERETEFLPCKFGLDNGNYSEVREGLTEGAVVYTKLPSKREEKDKAQKKGRKS
ncbi:MAG: HlyD family efflux transporter periplasmic adaptor subunit [Planctomycetota bacterium]